MSDKAEYNKKYYEANKPYPVRLGELKAKLQQEAFEEDKSIHYRLKKIVSDYFEKKELSMTGS